MAEVLDGPVTIQVIETPPTLIDVIENSVTIIEVIQEGPRGLPGLDGSAAAASLSIEIEVPNPASTWILSVPDNFGRRPNVALYLSSGENIMSDVVASSTWVTVIFSTPTSGTAVLT